MYLYYSTFFGLHIVKEILYRLCKKVKIILDKHAQYYGIYNYLPYICATVPETVLPQPQLRSYSV